MSDDLFGAYRAPIPPPFDAVAGVLRGIRAVLMDVDGVLTDGYAYVSPAGGDVLRGLNSRDCFALQLAARLGYPVAVITGGTAAGVRERLLRLGVQDVYCSVPYKATVYDEYLAEKRLAPEETLFIGDDMTDLEIMRRARLGVAPVDAAPDVLAGADVVTRAGGGAGCVRETLEAWLKARGDWYTAEVFRW